MQLRSILRSNRIPHILATFQWIILVLNLAFNPNLTVSMTGAVANGGFKIIMFFSVWMLFFSGVLCLLFYRIRKEGVEEKSIVFLSILTVLFSGMNISLHFANDLLLAMKAAEIIAWTLYNSIFFVSIYKISRVYLFPSLRISPDTKQIEHRNERKLWA